MANKFITPQMVANEALMQLEANLVMVPLVHRDYEGEFDGAVGDTIMIRKPASFTANDFTGNIKVQDIVESKVPVTLDRLVDVSFKFGSKERTLDIKDLSVQAIIPAMQAIADRMDKDLLNVSAENIKSVQAEAKPTKLTDIGKIANIFDNNKVPTALRNLVMCPDHRYRYLDTDLSNASYSGSTAALRMANLGRVYNFDTFMDQNCLQSTAEVAGTATKLKVTGNVDENFVAASGVTPATGTFKVGDVIVIDGRRYTVAKDATAESGAIAKLELKESLHKTIETAVDAYVGNKPHSLAFHRNAMTFASRTLALPAGGVQAAVATNNNGLGIRAVFGYDQKTKTEICSLDVLYGIKVLEPKALVNLIG